MNNIARLLSRPSTDVVVDKYTGTEFTIEEISGMVSDMAIADSSETVDQFCERFVDYSELSDGQEETP